MSLDPFIAAQLIAELNQNQHLAAISGPEQSLRIIAGPGTGKTKTLAYRFLALTIGRGLPAHKVLALTFTEKAALEMTERVQGLLPPDQQPNISTFHAFAARLLHEAAAQNDGNRAGTILNELDRTLLQNQLFAEIMNEPELAQRYPNLNFDDPAALSADVFAAIERLRDAYKTPEAVLAVLPLTSEVPLLHDLLAFTAQVYAAYRNRLKSRNRLDFAELVYQAYYVLKDDAALRQHYQRRFVHILVDEFQDTSLSQLEFLRLLSPDFGNVTVVGDRKQSIYGWRNARPENFEDAALLKSRSLALTLNYRSYQPILDLAASLLQGLVADGDKLAAAELALQAHKSTPAESQCVTFARPADAVPKEDAQQAEAAYIAAEIQRLRHEPAGDAQTIAILLRSVRGNSQPYEDALRAAGLAYVTVGGSGFYDQQEVLDLIAALRLLCNPADGQAFYRLAVSARFNLSQLTLQRLAEIARLADNYVFGNDPVFEPAARLYLTAGPFAPERTALELLLRLLEAGRAKSKTFSLSAMVKWVIENLSLEIAPTQNRPVAMSQAEANCRKLYELAMAFEQAEPQAGLPVLAVYLTLWLESDLPEQLAVVESVPGTAKANPVQIMTIHQSKGLEFDTVFVARQKPFSFKLNRPGQAAPLFVYLPGREVQFRGGFALLNCYNETGEKREKGPDYAAYFELEKTRALQEERYVLYVALTRARHRLYLTTPVRAATDQARPAPHFFFRQLAEGRAVTYFQAQS